MRYALGWLLMASCLLSLSAQAQTRAETLRWTHPGTRDGFKVYSGILPRVYGPPVDVGLPTPDGQGVYEYALSVPLDADTYVAVTAYDATPLPFRESPYSNEQQRCASDLDGDGVCTAGDNCREQANPSQFDADGDGFGNRCDPDYDNNGRVGASDFGFIMRHFGHDNEDPLDAVIDTSEPPDGVVGASDFGWFVWYFGSEPGP